MHLQHRPRLNLISRRMVVGVGRSPAGMDRCVWVNRTLASCASGSSRRCPGQRSSYGHRGLAFNASGHRSAIGMVGQSTRNDRICR